MERGDEVVPQPTARPTRGSGWCPTCVWGERDPVSDQNHKGGVCPGTIEFFHSSRVIQSHCRDSPSGLSVVVFRVRQEFTLTRAQGAATSYERRLTDHSLPGNESDRSLVDFTLGGDSEGSGVMGPYSFLMGSLSFPQGGRECNRTLLRTERGKSEDITPYVGPPL